MQITSHTVCLLCSKTASVLNVVLHSPSTSMFKILTATTLYDFYPTLSRKRVALTIPKGLDLCPSLIYSFGMRSYAANSPLYRDCVRSCPIEIRSTRFLKGIARSVWRSPDLRLTGTRLDPFEAEDLKWRLGNRCDNQACDYRGRDYSLYGNAVSLYWNNSV